MMQSLFGAKPDDSKKKAHDEKERKFLAAMGGVRADNTGTGMGSTDKEGLDKLAENVSFDKLPACPPKDEMPEVKPPPVQHDSLMDDLHKTGHQTQATSLPAEYDEKTRRFISTFNGVPDSVAAAKYQGQAGVPEGVDIKDMPSKVTEATLGEVPVVHRPDPKLADDKVRDAPITAGGDNAHDAFVRVFDGVPERS